MVPGINRVLEHEEVRYLIECEDLGIERAAFELRISSSGNLLWQKRISYRELVDRGSDESSGGGELEAEVRVRMDRAAQTASAAVVQGKVRA